MNNIENEPFSILIPDGESCYALPVLTSLGQQKNLKIFVISNNSSAPVRYSRYVTKFFFNNNGRNADGKLSFLLKTLEQTKADIILPIDEPAIRLLSINKDKIKQFVSTAPIPETNTFDIAVNKWKLSEWMKRNEIPAPKTILYKQGKEFEEALESVSFPVLIKPVYGSGGRGIKFFSSLSELLSFLKSEDCDEKYIIQSFVKGYDIDCSALCKEGKIIAYTIQKGIRLGSQKFIPQSCIDFTYDECTYNTVSELIRKFNWSGIVHIDLRYDEVDKNIKVIEMNPRFWGSLLGSLSAGVNFPYLTCLAGLNYDMPACHFHHIRYVESKIASIILIKRLLHRRNHNLFYDNSTIQYTVKDPLPKIIYEFEKLYRKLS